MEFQPRCYIIFSPDTLVGHREGKSTPHSQSGTKHQETWKFQKKLKMPIECGHPLLTIFDQPNFVQPSCILAITRNHKIGFHSCTVMTKTCIKKLPPLFGRILNFNMFTILYVKIHTWLYHYR